MKLWRVEKLVVQVKRGPARSFLKCAAAGRFGELVWVVNQPSLGFGLCLLLCSNVATFFCATWLFCLVTCVVCVAFVFTSA